MAKVNIDILGISELKQTGMGEFTSDDHYIDYCGQESLRRNGVAMIVNKRVQMQYLGAILKKNDLCSFPRQTIQYHSNPSLCPNRLCWRSWSWMSLWRPTRPFRTNTQKRCPFHYMGLECKSRKSRNTWNNRQISPWSTEWSRAKANRVLAREHTGHSKHPLPTTQEKTLHMDITRWSIPKSDWLYFCGQRWRSSIHSAKTILGADCDTDHELLIAKFRLKLKKEGKTTRPLRYDQNQLPKNYTVEVTNRFKGLAPIGTVSEELWTKVHNIVQ